MKSAAIVSAAGIGDGLLMMIAAHQLAQNGYAVTFYTEHAQLLYPLFPHIRLEKHPPIDAIKERFSDYDLIILENDNSERAWRFFRLRKEKKLEHLLVFFPTKSIAKTADDYLFDQGLPVATNIAKAMSLLLHRPISKENGITLPQHLKHRKHQKRLLFHPTSRDPLRNWSQAKFLKLAKRLIAEGYEISLCLSDEEIPLWQHVTRENIAIPEFESFEKLAHYIYESGFLIGNDSGLGHLASNLNIPTITISGNAKRARLWRPDWHLNTLVTLPFPLPNFHKIHLRLRDYLWHYLIPVKKVYNAFLEIAQQSQQRTL